MSVRLWWIVMIILGKFELRRAKHVKARPMPIEFYTIQKKYRAPKPRYRPVGARTFVLPILGCISGIAMIIIAFLSLIS